MPFRAQVYKNILLIKKLIMTTKQAEQYIMKTIIIDPCYLSKDEIDGVDSIPRLFLVSVSRTGIGDGLFEATIYDRYKDLVSIKGKASVDSGTLAIYQVDYTWEKRLETMGEYVKYMEVEENGALKLSLNVKDDGIEIRNNGVKIGRIDYT